MTPRRLLVCATVGLLGCQCLTARAEPHLAVQQGYPCAACHVNPAGGGLRNEFGNIYAQNVMPARPVDLGNDSWSGRVNRFVGIGGNLRGTWTASDIPGQPHANEFDVSEARLYLLAEPIPGRVSVYVDERLAPGAATNLESYARYRTANGEWSVQAGRMYLPFGLRIEDDSAFTRQVPGINMTTPDDGLQVGWDSAHWSAQLALSNGSGGGRESDSGKQVTAQATYVETRFRVGLGASINDSDAGDRRACSVFGGLQTGPLAWLGELALVEDEGFTNGTRTLTAGLLEAAWLVTRGHNVRLTAEWFDPDSDVDEDDQARWSVVYEFAPLQFLQLRAGARINDGIPQNDLQNMRRYFLELHGFF